MLHVVIGLLLLCVVNCDFINGYISGKQESRLSATEKLKRLSAGPKPNFLILFADDLGYGDLSLNGHPTIHTPNLDFYAYNGMRLSTWYSGFHICSPSRAAMLTGRLCVRSGTCGTYFGSVFRQGSNGGLPTNETSFATILKKVGYKTKAIGKWHLGVKAEYMPLNHGFDEYFGIPYSVDMGSSMWKAPSVINNPPLPLIQDNKIIEQPADLSKLSNKYYNAAISFIQNATDNKEPWLLYLPFSHVHVPDYLSEQYCNTSKRGFFGGALEELDNLIGNIMHYIESIGVDDNTLVFFTSDNGPWTSQRLAGGSAGLFRSGKETTWEGGVRMPAFVYWPNMIDRNQISMEITATYDIFSTIINIANATAFLPNDSRVYDGKDMSDIIFSLNGGKSKHECIFYWGGMPNDTSCPYPKELKEYGLCAGLWAVRCNQYKAHWVTRTANLSMTLQDPPLLYNINFDPSELHPIWPDNDEYNNIMTMLTNEKNIHLATIKKVENQIEKGTSADNWFCGDPNSQQKYPQYPNCTMTVGNWNAFVCSPMCLGDDQCGTSYPG